MRTMPFRMISRLEQLPDELLLVIFSYVDAFNLQAFENLNARFNAIVHDPLSYKFLDYVGRKSKLLLAKENLVICKFAAQLVSLTLDGKTDFEWHRFQRLQHLTLCRPLIDRTGILASLVQLRSIHIKSGGYLKFNHSPVLHVTILKLDDCSTQELLLHWLPNMPRLERVIIKELWNSSCYRYEIEKKESTSYILHYLHIDSCKDTSALRLLLQQLEGQFKYLSIVHNIARSSRLSLYNLEQVLQEWPLAKIRLHVINTF